MGPNYWGPDYWWGHGMWIIPLIFLAIMFIGMIIFMLIFGRGFCGPWAGRWDKSSRHDLQPSESALDILNKRYAKGEINKAEFEQIKKDILT
jgi:putative membrane protein